ncbi:MAG: PucR family transcriptional regulator [Nocardioidaceae bacterium]
MAATLDQLLSHPDLGLTELLHYGDKRAIRWVATSELRDPTPYLEGGELLLTTGMGLPKTRPAVDRYIRRLIDAGVVALGFGVGVVHDEVPPHLLTSARAQGLSLMEVDRPTPFIAISKAVSDLLAREQYGEITAAYEAQQQITRAALRQGAAGVVSRLARVTNGFVVLLDPHGDVVQASRRTTVAEREAWTPDLERLRLKGRAAVATTQIGDHRMIQSLGSAGRVRGYLVTGQTSPPKPPERALVNVAAALLTFSLAHEGGDRDRLARSALMGLATKHPDLMTGQLGALAGPVFDGGGLWVIVAAGTDLALERLHEHLEDEGRSHCYPWQDGDLLSVVVADEQQLGRVLGLATAETSMGASDRVNAAELRAARDQALHSLHAARSRREPALRFSDVARSGLIGIADTAAAGAFAEATLAPLVAYERSSKVELRESVRVWLAHHGQFGPAASALGVHRHTLRYRVRKAAELTGRDLDEAATRMELWFALTVHFGQGRGAE